MPSEIINALKMVAGEKAIKMEDLVHIIEEAVTAAAAKRLGRDNLAASFDPARGEFDLFELLEIKNETSGNPLEIALADVLEHKPDALVGQTYRRQIQMEGLGRIAAQSVRQMIHKKGKELELDRLFARLKSRAGEVTMGKVIKRAGDGWLIDIGGAEAILPKQDQLENDKLERGKNVKLLIVDAERGKKEPIAIVSRSHPSLLRKLIAIESPEVADGQVEIVALARDSSGRAKVAVRGKKPGVDPVGAIIGVRGGRIQPIVSEFAGEKIDIFEWSDDPARLIQSALTPARDLLVIPLGKEKKAAVVAPESQLSPAIGKKGVNIKLATKIAGWELDVVSQTEYKERKNRIHYQANAAPAENPPQGSAQSAPETEGEKSGKEG